ncbi:MAG: LURP-one-related family protein [Bacteroidota bacterium]
MQSYLIKKRSFAGRSYDIFDAAGQMVYFIKPQPFSFGISLDMYDPQGEKVATLIRKWMVTKTTYEVFLGETLFAEIKRTSLFSPNLMIDLPGDEHDLTVTNKWMSRKFKFYHGKTQIAQAEKKALSLMGEVKVNILADEDELMILATATLLSLRAFGNS